MRGVSLDSWVARAGIRADVPPLGPKGVFRNEQHFIDRARELAAFGPKPPLAPQWQKVASIDIKGLKLETAAFKGWLVP